MSEKKVRANVVIRGKVQGVFFRAETLKAATGYNLSGWVKNKKDGTVEAVFEGQEKNVVLMLEWCKKGSPHSKVEKTDVKWDDYQGGFSDFEIIY